MASEPDLIIGIDVGMSCTGVAFQNKTRSSVESVKTFRAWPGRREESKVPTRLSYDTRYPRRKPLRWGFECDADNDRPNDLKVEEWFKLDLGKAGVDQERVKKLYTDYMECLYMTLFDHFTSRELYRKSWDDAVIEFAFSVPATWSTDVVDVFKHLAFDAGFGQCAEHKVTASLTEPQAVAAFTLCEEKIFNVSPRKISIEMLLTLWQNGETILIVDAGGGTLDLCLLRIDNKDEGRVATTELNPVVGDEIGSTYIDTGFQELTERLLEPIKHLLNSDAKDVAWQMSNTHTFQANKHELGKGRYEEGDCFKIKIPDLREVITDKTLRVDRGEMVFHWSDLERLFQTQVEGIKTRMIEVLDNWALGNPQLNIRPGNPINHVILSGGLGSSRYVQNQLGDYCSNGRHAMLAGTNLLVSTEPQLAVCRGLINYAKQHVSMFPRRLARASFGIPCRRPYSGTSGKRWRAIQKEAKKDKRVKTDEFGHEWIENCMDWFIIKGSRINDGDRPSYKYYAKFASEVPPSDRTCRVQIMTCLDHPPPDFKDKGGVRSQAQMDVDLARVQARVMDKGFFKQMRGKKQHIEVEFIIEAVLGPAEVSFQCFDSANRRTPLSKPISLEMAFEEGDQAGSMQHAPLLRA
ncbi:Fc.00g039520.m01.CDS01 [Cosmosporella sp. VM-42]